MCLCVCIFACAWAHVCLCVCMLTGIQVYVFLCVCMFACVWTHTYVEVGRSIAVHLEPTVNTGNVWLLSDLILWYLSLSNTEFSNNVAGLISQLKWGSPVSGFCRWNYRPATMPILHLCGSWRSELQASWLFIKCFPPWTTHNIVVRKVIKILSYLGFHCYKQTPWLKQLLEGQHLIWAGL